MGLFSAHRPRIEQVVFFMSFRIFGRVLFNPSDIETLAMICLNTNLLENKVNHAINQVLVCSNKAMFVLQAISTVNKSNFTTYLHRLSVGNRIPLLHEDFSMR